MLPGINGVEVCKRLRAEGNVGILTLTAKGELEDRIEGLDSGADDYLVKPFIFKELMARVRAILRRNGINLQQVLRTGDVVMDRQARRVSRSGRQVELTPREFDMLELFLTASAPGLSPRRDTQPRVGLRLHGRHERDRRAYSASARKAGRRRAQPDTERKGHRVRPGAIERRNEKREMRSEKSNGSYLISRLSFLRWDVPVGLQLSLIYAVLVAATLALLGWALYAQLDSFLVQSTAQGLGRVSSLDMQHSPPSPRGSPDQGVSFLVHQLSEQDTNVSVAVLNSEGQVLSSSQATLGGEAVTIPALPADWESRVVNGSQAPWVVDGAGGNRQLIVLTAITMRGPPGRADTPLYLEQVASLAAADAVLNQLRLYILLGIVLGTAIGIVAGLALTRLTLRPLDRMVRTAEAIAGGDLDRRLRLPAGRNEVARLGSAFDHMVDRLGSALEAQRRFVADASHELRTPLTSLEGLSEMLLIGADRGDTSVIQRSVRAMYKELARLGRLVTDLLTLSRLDSTTPMTLKPLDISKLIAEVADQMRPLAEARQVHVGTIHSHPVVVQAEPDRLKQVVLNLVDNAIRYTPPDGWVELSTAYDAQAGTARIDVSDTGPGIAPEDQAQIFERFYRADPARVRANNQHSHTC